MRFTARRGIMDKNPLVLQRNWLLVIVPVVAAIAVALFWGAWYLPTGRVPSVSSVTIGAQAYQLPYAISRIFDIPAAGVFGILGVLLWYSGEKKKRNMELILFPVGVGAIFFAYTAIFFPYVHDHAIAIIGGIAVMVCIPYGDDRGTYKETISECLFGSQVCAFSVGLGDAVPFGGVVGLGILAGMAVLYSMTFVLTLSAVYGISLMVRRRQDIVKSVVGWMRTHDM